MDEVRCFFRTWKVCAAVSLLSGLVGAAPVLAQTYTIRTLGPPPIPPTFTSVGKALNIKDEVLADGVFGQYNGTPSILLPLADYGMPAGLDYLPFSGFTNFTGLYSTWVISISLGYLDVPFRMALNDQGQILGTLKTPSHAGIWQNRQVRDLGTLGGPTSSPFALNQKGDVIGYSTTTPGDTHTQPFIVLAGSTQMQPIAGLDPSYTKLIAFNNQRQILATTTNGDVVWQNGAAQKAVKLFGFDEGPPLLPNPNEPGTFYMQAGTYNVVKVTALNDAGDIAGSVETTIYDPTAPVIYNVTYHSLIYSPAGGHGFQRGLNSDLYETPGLGPPQDLLIAWNSNGQIIFLTDYGQRAGPPTYYYWDKGHVQPLQNLVPAGSGWTDLTPYGINDRGDVVGQGNLKGVYQGFLLALSPLAVSVGVGNPGRIVTGDEIVVQVGATNVNATDIIGKIQQAGIVTAAGSGGVQFKSGPLPAGVFTLNPGQGITFTSIFLATNSGTVTFSATVTGTDPKGALSASGTSDPLVILPPLSLDISTIPPARANLGDVIEVHATVGNLSTVGNNVLSRVSLKGPLAVTGSGGVAFQSGPVPTGSVTLNPGASFTFTNRFLATNYGPVIFSGTATGTEASGAVDTVSATNHPVRIAPGGDLLIKRGVESADLYAGAGIFQTVPVAPQVKTNYVVANENSPFQVQVQNNDRQPLTFTLLASERGNDTWKRIVLLSGKDVAAALEAPGGMSLPTLDPGSSLTLNVTLQDTNANLGDIKRVDFTLGLASDPTLTLDAVEAVAEIAVEIIVNSTGDLPLKDPNGCCCDTGNKLADGKTPECSLRAAIQLANRHEGKDIIKFEIPSDDSGYNSGVPRIEPLTALPAITDPVVIDGWSQNTAAVKPPIELAGDKISPGIAAGVDLPYPDRLIIYPDGVSGLVIEAGYSEIRGLVVNRFPFCGIELGGGRNIIQGNYLGTDAAGQIARGNGSWGIRIQEIAGRDDNVRGCGIWVRSGGNQIGGTGSRNANVLSGLSGSRARTGAESITDADQIGVIQNGAFPPQILILGATATQNTIEGNLIGTQFDGLQLIQIILKGGVVPGWDGNFGAGTVGITVAGSANQIGGTAPGSGNTFAFNFSSLGAEIIGGSAQGNVVQGNHFGTDASGTVYIGYGGAIAVSAPNNRIGGSQPGAGNFIMGASGAGVILAGDQASNNVIEGNQIGPLNQVSPPRAASRFSNGRGVDISDGASNNLISGNTIANNEYEGIRAAAFDRVGQTASNPGTTVPARQRGNLAYKNQIYGHGYYGASAGCYPGIELSQNSIHDNGTDSSLPGVGPSAHRTVYVNDSGDLDICQNYPLLVSAVTNAGLLTVKGNLSSKLNGGTYRIEFFANRSTPDGYGEGETYLGSVNVDVGLGGLQGFLFTVPVPSMVAVGMFVTANATSSQGITSEFSNAVQIQGAVSNFPNKGISNALQQQVPSGNGSLSSVSANFRSHLQQQNGAAPIPRALARGDGNGDGIQDYLQANVASFPGITGPWITLVSPTNTALENVTPSGPPDFTNIPAGYTFPLGFVSLSVTGLTPGTSVTVTNFFHDAIEYDTVFAYGPTPANAQPHWYEFLFDGTAGAILGLSGFTLTFLDGDGGDSDLKANGVISTVFAAAQKSPPGPHLSLLSTQVGQASVLDDVQDVQGSLTLIANRVPVVSSILTWPASATNYALYMTETLPPSGSVPNPDSFSLFNSWQPASGTPVLVNGQNILTNTTFGNTHFYQLRAF